MAALPRHVTAVGVFVNHPPPKVAALAVRIGLGTVQLHGQESVEDLGHLGELRVIRAFRLRAAESWEFINNYLKRAEAIGRPLWAVLIDAYVPGIAGGTGTTIETAALDARPPLPRLILAGGLTPGNVAERIERVRPWMVDVASGVESAPGRKDPESVASFLRAVRSRPPDGGDRADR